MEPRNTPIFEPKKNIVAPKSTPQCCCLDAVKDMAGAKLALQFFFKLSPFSLTGHPVPVAVPIILVAHEMSISQGSDVRNRSISDSRHPGLDPGSIHAAPEAGPRIKSGVTRE
ncbi:hypothetical protein ATM17_07325 [Sphingopyxis macrogoltabida]|uniref:Uncharacterized protein n=1 Tax=Sphingopyxis macrogoltabida TaxID=33050 RepID=A0AAC8YZM8_SPHMC|nr:hypothetical protein LH19_12565 [Sphingopyxis macrogoltabida]AMU88852.1 hypothetical protein ATM17_07325 [Sphingopyxis macrogoltabida]